MLRSVGWYLVTNYQNTLRNIPEEWKPRLHRGKSLKSLHSVLLFFVLIVILYILQGNYYLNKDSIYLNLSDITSKFRAVCKFYNYWVTTTILSQFVVVFWPTSVPVFTCPALQLINHRPWKQNKKNGIGFVLLLYNRRKITTVITRVNNISCSTVFQDHTVNVKLNLASSHMNHFVKNKKLQHPEWLKR